MGKGPFPSGGSGRHQEGSFIVKKMVLLHQSYEASKIGVPLFEAKVPYFESKKVILQVKKFLSSMSL